MTVDNLALMQTAIDNLDVAIAGYASALAADSVNPLESYSLDGENVTRAEWRTGLGSLIESLSRNRLQIQKDLNARKPFQVGIRQVL